MSKQILDSSSSFGICTLERGKLPADSLRTSDLREILEISGNPTGKALIETMKRVIQSSGEWDHSGIHHGVVFRTDRSITLHSLGFWGPHNDESAEYSVSIIISSLTSLIVAKQKRVTLSKFRKHVTAKRRGVFMVPLEEPVEVPAGNWIQIEFELNGPPTYRSEEVHFDYLGEGGVSFNFSNSSLQMPIIKYRVL